MVQHVDYIHDIVGKPLSRKEAEEWMTATLNELAKFHPAALPCQDRGFLETPEGVVGYIKVRKIV